GAPAHRQITPAAGTGPAAGSRLEKAAAAVIGARTDLGSHGSLKLFVTHGIVTGFFLDLDHHFLGFITSPITGQALGRIDFSRRGAQLMPLGAVIGDDHNPLVVVDLHIPAGLVANPSVIHPPLLGSGPDRRPGINPTINVTLGGCDQHRLPILRPKDHALALVLHTGW